MGNSMNRNNGVTLCEQKEGPQSLGKGARAKNGTENLLTERIIQEPIWNVQPKIGWSIGWRKPTLMVQIPLNTAGQSGSGRKVEGGFGAYEN